MENSVSNGKIKVALMADVIDRRPERTIVGRRLVENLLKHPEVEIYLIHYRKMPDDPLYQRAHEIIIPLLPLPWASHFLSFLWFCLRTREKFDIFQWMVARPYPFFWLVPTKKIVITAHDGNIGLWTIPNIIFWAMIRFFNKYIAAVIGVSDFANKEIISTYHIPPGKVFTVYNSIDLVYRPIGRNTASEMLKKYKINFNKYFLYIGGLVPHKNAKRMIEAYDLLRGQIGAEEKLLIVGRFSYGTDEILETAKKSRYGGDIHFIDYVSLEDMPAVYSSATALILVSLSEGFGLPIAEAMACGTPVITSNISAMPEAAGGAALLVDPYDPADIMKAMKRVSEDAVLRKNLSDKGLKRVKIFTWEKYAEGNLDVYKKVLRK